MSGPGMLVRAGLGVLLLTAALGTPADADLWGHLTFGRDIVQTGRIVQADRYSFTSDRSWVNHEWLAEVTMAQAYRVAGPTGLVGLKVAAIAALLLLVWRHVRRLRPPAPVPLAFLVLVFVGTFWRMHTVRPQLFSVLYFAVLLIAMVSFDEGRRGKILVVPLLMALWVNVHGGWIVGLAVLGLWITVRILDRRSDFGLPHRLMLAAVGLLSVGATLLNPYGMNMWTFLSETVHLGRDDIEEWGSILTHPVALGLPWFLMLLAAGLAIWRSPRMRRFDYLSIVGVLAVLSFRVSRLDAFFALAVCVLLAPALASALGQLVRRQPITQTVVTSAPTTFGPIVITIVAVGAMLLPAAPLISRYTTCLPIDGPWVPEADAARFIALNRLSGRMVTWFDWGEYAIWHFAPDLRVSMDGRRETVYTEQTIQAHRRFYAADDTAGPYLHALDPEFVWVPQRVPIAKRLGDAGWTPVFSGPISVVFARPGAGPFQQVASAPKRRAMLSGPMTHEASLSPAQHRLIQIHLALIPVYGWLLVVWTAYAIDISTAGRIDRSGHIKGHDFAHFYVLGQIANEHASGDLYDFAAQSARLDRLVPEYEHRVAPIHGPQLSLFFAPLARLPYQWAVGVWIAITFAGYALCCALLWAAAPNPGRYRWLAVILAAGYPAFYLLIAFGQDSIIALACITAAYFAMRAKRPWLAGLALGSLIYKPPFGLVLPFVLFYGREWRMIAGAAAAAILEFGAAAAYYGPEVLRHYLDAVLNVGQIAQLLEPIPYQMQSLRSFFVVLMPWSGVAWAGYLLASAAVVVLAARCWRSRAALDLRFSVLLLAMVLVDPHVNPYDLIVITPVFFLTLPWVAVEGRPRLLLLLLCLSYYLPALTFLPTVTHVQVSVVVLFALTVVLVRLAARDEPRPSSATA